MGVAVEVALGVLVTVDVREGVTVEVSVEVAVDVKVGVAVREGVGVCVDVLVEVFSVVSVDVDVSVTVRVAVRDGVAVKVGVAVDVAVDVGVAVSVWLGVMVRVMVRVAVRVHVGVMVGVLAVMVVYTYCESAGRRPLGPRLSIWPRLGMTVPAAVPAATTPHQVTSKVPWPGKQPCSQLNSPPFTDAGGLAPTKLMWAGMSSLRRTVPGGQPVAGSGTPPALTSLTSLPW